MHLRCAILQAEGCYTYVQEHSERVFGSLSREEEVVELDD